MTDNTPDPDLVDAATERQTAVIMTQTLATLIAIPLAVLGAWGLSNPAPWKLIDIPELLALVATFYILWQALLSIPNSLRTSPKRPFDADSSKLAYSPLAPRAHCAHEPTSPPVALHFLRRA